MPKSVSPQPVSTQPVAGQSVSGQSVSTLSVSTGTFLRVEWRFLLFGVAMAFSSSLGQTYFISLFSAHIRDALSLTHGDFGTYYAIATTCSAITLLWLGKLADTMRVERLALLVISALAVAALLFSQVFSVISLIFGLYLLRLFGQGMTTHTYVTAMARRYVVARGRAISIATLGMNAAESIGPASVVAMMAIIDWRTVWLILPVGVWLALAPALRYLTKRTALQDGPGLDGLEQPNSAPPSEDEIAASYGDVKQWRRAEVLRDGQFWGGLLGLQLVPNFTMTGIMFHQIYLAEVKGVPLTQWTASYVIYAICAVIGGLLTGQLVDRFTARRVAPLTMLPMAAACLILWLGDAGLGITLFFTFMGLAAGMPFTAHAALISELYGTRYLGEIKSIFLPAGVFASALSPMVMGILIDFEFGLSVLMGMNFTLAILATISALVTFAIADRRR